MSDPIERVCRTIARYRLLPPGARVIVAASGGADSTALACLLHQLAPRFGFRVTGLAHFNHLLRGAASDEDERACRALAERLQVPFHADRGDVRSAARSLGTSVEDAGRRLRYAFFDDLGARTGASAIAVGHTRDDQAETLLLNLLRGAGPLGLAGIRPLRGSIVRPLLDCDHVELVAWLRQQGVPYREDESNADERYSRNRVRRRVVPVLVSEFPHAVESLVRSAEIARADADWLDELARDWPERPAVEADGTWTAGLDVLMKWPPALARRVVLDVLRRLAGGKPVGFDAVERVLELAGAGSPGPLLLPGAAAAIDAGRLVIRARTGRDAGRTKFRSPAGNSFRAALSIPGEAPVSGGIRVSSDLRFVGPTGVSRAAILEWVEGGTRGAAAVVDADRVGSNLAVRFRRPGDWIRPLGSKGRKTLQDLFVDRKIPRGDRERTPIVVDAADRVVWVAGHVVSEDFRVGDATRAVVILKLRGERV